MTTCHPSPWQRRTCVCDLCGLLYCPDIASDRRVHNRLHRNALDAQQALATSGPESLPLSYAAREEMKRRHTTSPEQHLELVMWSHLARSLEAMDYDFAKHPSWLSYARAYLAQPRMRELFGDAAVDQVIPGFESDRACGESRTPPAFYFDPGGSYARLAKRRAGLKKNVKPMDAQRPAAP